MYARAVFSPRLCAALRAVSALQLCLQGAPAVPFFQHVHLRPTSVELHYRAERVDVAALRDGRVSELVNLVPWEGVALDIRGVRMAGLQVRRLDSNPGGNRGGFRSSLEYNEISPSPTLARSYTLPSRLDLSTHDGMIPFWRLQGWDGVTMSAAKEWLQDITQSQLHKFLTGMAPVKRVAKVLSAVSALLYGSGGADHGQPRDVRGSTVAVVGQVAEKMQRTVSAAARSQLLAQVIRSLRSGMSLLLSEQG